MNDNGLQTLMCITDRVDCCETPALGNWYYPNGSIVGYNQQSSHVFQSNRGQHETINGNQAIIYGSVRIWHRYTPPATERGLFHCELPDANGINHRLYVNIRKLITDKSVVPTIIILILNAFFNSAF